MGLNKLNNKGYMLVEIILAFALAFGIAYFMLDMTIRLKNKNDDLFVTTLVATDQAIITNMIMEDLYSTNGSDFSCDNIQINDKQITYNGKTNILNEYTSFDNMNCSVHEDFIEITIPLNVKILDNDFDINIVYKK